MSSQVSSYSGAIFKGIISAADCLLKSFIIESTPIRLLASISVLGGREEGARWWAWEHHLGREEGVGGGSRGLAT